MELTGIALFYLTCTAIGLIFALAGAILGEFGAHAGVGAHGGIEGHDIGHADTDVQAHEIGAHDLAVGHSDMPGASLFNTITISTFVGFFGIAGLVAVWVFRMGTAWSVAFALPAGMIIGLAEFVLYVKVFIRAQASSEATMDELIGHEAEVITSIPGNGVGEIAYIIRGTRYSAPAVTEDGSPITHGHKVLVMGAKGSYMVVTPFD